MANSNQDKQVDSDFEDELDKMLQDTADQIKGESTTLDTEEDTIDRLLDANMDREQTDLGQPDNVDDLVDSLLDEATNKNNVSVEQEIDEFSEDEVDEFAEVPESSNLESDAIDELLGTAGKAEIEKPAEAEVDTFTGELLNEQEVAAVEPGATEDDGASMSEDNMTEIDEFADELDEDFLLADFDITADEEVSENSGSVDTPEKPVEAEKSIIIEPEPVVEQVSEPEQELKPTPQRLTPQPTAIPNNESDRILSLENAVADLKNSLNETEAIDKLIKSQKKSARNTEEATAKVKTFSISALIIGLLALIIGITVLVLNLGVQSDVEEVQNTVLDIEDRLSVPVINPDAKKIEKLQEYINGLDAEIKTLQSQLAEVSIKLVDENKQELAQFKEIIEGELSLLSEKISVLEQKSKRVVRKSKSRLIKQTEWVVNLVSFKQRWYTDQKVAEFKKKGIPAEIVPIIVKGTQWFRVRVIGFASKTAAKSYALKMKKSLNLNSVWVSRK